MRWELRSTLMGKDAARRAAVVDGVNAERSSWGLVSARRWIVGGAMLIRHAGLGGGKGMQWARIIMNCEDL